MHDVYLCLHSSQIRSSKSTKKPTHATRRIIFTTVKNYDTIIRSFSVIILNDKTNRSEMIHKCYTRQNWSTRGINIVD